MSDLRDLYQELILDHNKRPRNFRRLDGANRSAEGYNPLCGDKVTVYLKVEDGVVKDVSFEGSGCAISKASASVMTETLKGRKLAEIEELFKRFHEMVTGRKGGAESEAAELGKLEAFSGVCEFPARVKCAILAWYAMRAALEGASHSISTE